MHFDDRRLTSLGWNSFFQTQWANIWENTKDSEERPAPARVTEELKGHYRVSSESGEYLAELAGKLTYIAVGRDQLPAVGDWVGIRTREGGSKATICCILPRRTKLSRKMAGRELGEQMVAANIDTVFVVTSLNHDFNLRRIERYLAMTWESGARPVILLNKADLCDDTGPRLAEAESIAPGVPVCLLSAHLGSGLEVIRQYLVAGETAAFVGSSGVGKSTIINALSGSALLRVQPIGEGDERGRHTTTSRQMFFLPQGGIVIDTPGMRELQLWESDDGLSETFLDIVALSERCKFRDCTHGREPGCAVQAAVGDGSLSGERLESFRKLNAESSFHERKSDPEMERAHKEKWKKIHKEARNKGNRY